MRYWLQNTRLARGLTPGDVCAELGVSEEYYLAVEGGRRQKKMDLTLIAKLSVILKVSMAWILEQERIENSEEQP
ncbi:MAG: helix-turn-helix transcriptional regulator [Oscillospiraceae bacterium]|nr:helix-turn-helix transcriptional regulator [Oscillospiraceae bacterium]